MGPSATVTSSIKARPRCCLTVVSSLFQKHVEISAQLAEELGIHCIFSDGCAGFSFRNLDVSQLVIRDIRRLDRQKPVVGAPRSAWKVRAERDNLEWFSI